jgi:hypothetical protein
VLAPEQPLGHNDTTGTPEETTRTSGKAHLVHLREVPLSTRGVLYVHSATSAVTPHIEWAVAGVVSMPVRFDWTPQPAAPGAVRAEISWIGEAGCAGRLASVLIGWPVRFEVTEDPSAGCDGERYAFTPSLGLFHAMTSANGDLVVPENRLRQLFASQLDIAADGGRSFDGPEGLDGIKRLLGEPWDAELESFRYAGDGAPVRWLHQVV